MEPNVPPNFFRIIDAPGLDEELAEIFVLGERLERIGNSSPRKALKHFQAITLEPGVLPDPER